MYFLPFIFLMFLGYLVILGVLFLIVQIGIIGYAFESIGIPAEYILGLLVLSLLGSGINIPVTRVPYGIQTDSQHTMHFMGWQFRVPEMPQRNDTLIAVNLGGALIPIGISVYILITHAEILLPSLIAIAIVTIVVNKLARPINGVGIGVPLFIPPIIAAVAALLLTNSQAPMVAYAAGTIGTLVGADLLNLNKIGGLGTTVASIGGAGTFDGIFLTGIIAVILASI